MQAVTPFLWFNNNAEEAMNFYASVFKDVQIGKVARYGENMPLPAGTVMSAEFSIKGQNFIALNGGPMYSFNPAISFLVACDDQAEIDAIWEKLSADPSAEQCGWLKDKFGLSWQIVPANLPQLLQSPAAVQAMMSMKKIDIKALEVAGK